MDVVVVGAGYTGLSAARRLALAGARVLVVDRGGIGFGASSRNAGQVLTGLRVGPATLVSTYGESRARELFRAGTDAIAHLERLLADESIECDYERVGHVVAAAKPAHFAEFQEEQRLLARVFDHPVTLVPRGDQRRELGSDAYHGLLVDERSAALNPAKYVNGLARAAVRAGACIATGVGVERLERDGSGWRVGTSAGAVEAGDVVAATDSYTTAAFPALQRRLVPIGSSIIVTEPLSHDLAAAVLPTRRTAFDSKHFLFYFRLTPDQRLLFGGRAEFSQPDEAGTNRAGAILHRGMASVFPALAGVRIDYVWSGSVAFTRDQLPHAGRLDGMWFAAGYCGHGIAMATFLGDLVARRMAAGGGRGVTHPFLDDNWPAIPFYDGRPWFLPIAGAYYRVMDWMS